MSVDWPQYALKEVCAIRPPKSEARRKLADHDSVSFMPMEDLGINQKIANPTKSRLLAEVAGSYTYFAEGDVLLAKITPCFENGKLGIATGLANGVGFGSSEFVILRPSCSLHNDWLYYFLSRESFRREGAARMGGAVGHKRVEKEFLEDYRIPVPPLPEQRRIVSILDEAFAALEAMRANAEKNLQNARAIFDSYLEILFGRHNAEWQVATLQDVCDKITDGTHQTPKYFDTGYVFLSSRNVTSGVIDWENIKFIDESQHLEMQRRVSPRVGDLLLAKNGTTGVAALVDRDIDFDIYVSLALLRPNRSIRSDFLLLFINSPIAKQQFNKRLKGVGVPNLHLKEIREVEIAYPQSRKTQQRIAEEANQVLEQVRRLEALYTQKLAAIDALKQSILQKAFAGELTAAAAVAA